MRNRKTKNLKLKTQRGFTMIELLVAMSLFVVVTALVSGVFVRALRTQKTLVSFISANSNAALAIEQMTREMRTGSNFSAPAASELVFTNAKNEEVTYRLANDALERGVGGAFNSLTSSDVLVKKINFLLLEDPAFPPRITVALQVGSAGARISDYFVNLQTTISARSF